MAAKSQLIFLIALSTIMVVLFTIISDSTFCYHSDIILGMMIVFFAIIEADFTGIIRTVSREYYLLLKPSAFESEIHPLHKLRLCNGDFALAGGKFTLA